jgi:hypothetical protein
MHLKRFFSVVLIGVSLITTGCSVTTISDKGEKPKKEIGSLKTNENSPVTPIIDNKYDFTYLEKLPVEKLEKYNLFLEDGNTNHLTDFKPEQIVLIYMNLVLKHNVDKLYALTYDNGQLPSLDIFINEYDYYLSPLLNDDYLTYRFYDAISVDKATRKKDELVVKMDIMYGTTTQGITYNLKKDNDVWKMDLYHLVEEQKGNKNG